MLRLTACFALLVSALVAVAPAQAQKGRMTRVSVADDEAQANGASTQPALSADGRYVAFTSAASNLVAGDTNGLTDIFVRDRIAETTVRVNLSNAKEETTGATAATGGSSNPSISGDGRFVAFASNASNLVAGDTNNKTDVFVRDLREGKTILVSANGEGRPGDDGSDFPRISADGTTVVFSSFANDLVSGAHPTVNIFVRDISEKDRGTEIVNVDGAGNVHSAEFEFAAISGDGNLIAFSSESRDLVPGDTNGGANDIFLRDRAAGTTKRVNVDDNGVQPTFFASHSPAISTDGGTVAYVNGATNFVGPDTGSAADVFVYDVRKGAASRASVDTAGAPTNAHADHPALSGDGLLVAFGSSATNLASGVGGGLSKVFLRDRKGKLTFHAGFNLTGGAPDAHTSGPALSSAGTALAFATAATNIVSGDTNSLTDVFVNDLTAPSPATVSHVAGQSLQLTDGPMVSSSWAVTRTAPGVFGVNPLSPATLPNLGSGCSRTTGVVCTGGVDSVFATLGDGHDKLNAAGCSPGNASGGATGGDGNDVLVGGNGDDTLNGGPGDDRLIGCAGRDLFFGGQGFDRLDYPGSAAVEVKINNEHVSGTPGEQDRIVGDIEHLVTGSGNDKLEGDGTLDGGAGDDRFLGQGGISVMIGGAGVDTFDARGGADVVMARDGVADRRIDCGTGTDVDSADLDLFDTPVNCENVTQGAVGERPNVELGADRPLKLRDGKIAVVVSCPRAVRHPCAGTLVAARTVGALARASKASYSVRAGRRATVRVRADKSVRRRTRAYLQSIEKGDVRGVKTTRSYVRIAR